MADAQRHNSKSNSACRSPQQPPDWDPAAGGGSTAGSDPALILSPAQVEERAARLAPCRQAPPSSPVLPRPPPCLLEINGGGVNSQQPALSPRTNQCDQEEGERGIVFMESKFTVGELVTSAFVSFLLQGERFWRKEATLPGSGRLLVRPFAQTKANSCS